MYNLENLSLHLRGKILQARDTKQIVDTYLYDSRQIVNAQRAAFFAFVTPTGNGHDYLDDVVQKGVLTLVISQEPKQLQKRVNYILVKNTLVALQRLATHHRSQFDYPLLGIAGHKGKTIIKEWLSQLLNDDYNIIKSPKSYNSQLGVPLSLLQMRAHHQLGIIEAGISKVGEMKLLEAMIKPSTAILTNLSTTSSDTLTPLDMEKCLLFRNAEKIIFQENNTQLKSYLKKQNPSASLISWSFQEGSTYSISTHNKKNKSTRLIATKGNHNYTLELPLTGKIHIENTIPCWIFMLELGLGEDAIQKRFESIRPVSMRLELKAGANDCILVNDSYSNDLQSLAISLNYLGQHAGDKAKVVIVSSMTDLELSPSQVVEAMADMLLREGVKRVLGVGEDIGIMQSKLLHEGLDFKYYKNTKALKKAISKNTFRNEAILVKGARKYGLESIIPLLEKRTHRTVLEVNLSAMKHNLNCYRAKLNPSTNMMVMVKASAYGSGSVEVAKMLEQAAVDYLAVAYTDEGVELRENGVTLPIMVMNVSTGDFDTLVEHKLEAQVFSMLQLRTFRRLAEGGHQPMPIHLKIDTGMKRLGFEEKDLEDFLPMLSSSTFSIKSILSHLVASESELHRDFTISQIEKFTHITHKIESVLGYSPLRHILNSSGVSNFPEAQFDMIRLGIGLYGIDGNNKMQQELQVVSSLKARVSQVKELKVGESIGYGRTFVATKPMRTATLSIGYADGLSRQCSNGVYSVLVKGVLVPIIGKVCMDMCMVDVTEVSSVSEGDEVIIFGSEPTLQDLARASQTIPYEVLTAVPQRVKRIYYWE